ncbi:FBD-associated F-box protein At2g26860-like [Lactuca sativa]|uniref:FBD-associated F-box protein At2g26860-like n=1 Tax=Lactuca sativa TaxID=4236 RepID=UPI0022AF6938|nr:FBD-associated F-box protein At2g26860-like [Lactuca sativa]
MNNSVQRKASKHEDGVDLISNLPDPLLLLILSGLQSTEEQIRTSILSRRWRYLWTLVPSLDLKPLAKLQNSKFKEFVYWVLLNRSVDLYCFRLSGWDSYRTSTVERWIHATVMKNVKQLDLSFGPKEKYIEDMMIPHCLMTCTSLEVLRLSCRHRVILPRISGFPALRVLKLENVELFDNDLVKYFFLESCPLLEDLTLYECVVDKLDLLCVSCPNLKKLTLLNWCKYYLCSSLKLSCPKLVYLDLKGEVASSYIFECLYSLKEAVLYPECDAIFNKLFHEFSHLESLATNLDFLPEVNVYSLHEWLIYRGFSIDVFCFPNFVFKLYILLSPD